MARVTREELARFHDGELSASARKRVEEALRTSPEDRAYLANLERLGTFMRTSYEEQAAQVSFDGFADRVARGIQAAEKPGIGERLSVWLAEFFEHRRVVWIPAASLAGAAAAVLLVIPLVRDPLPLVQPPSGGAGGIWAASTDGALATATSRGSEAVLANRGQATGLEFSVLNERGEPIGVVWVND